MRFSRFGIFALESSKNAVVWPARRHPSLLPGTFTASVTPRSVARMRSERVKVARHPKPLSYGDRSMNAFRISRMFALVACTALVALSFSAAAQAKGSGKCHSGSGSFGSCRSYCSSYSSYCPSYSSYCPSYSSYCPSYSSYCPSYSSYCPSYCSYPVSYCPPTTYCAPQTCYAPVTTCSYTPVTEYVPVTNYVPTTTCNYSYAPTCTYPTYSTSCYQPSCYQPSCSYSSCYLPSYNKGCHPSGNFKFKK
jgi:hypothetical protein